VVNWPSNLLCRTPAQKDFTAQERSELAKQSWLYSRARTAGGKEFHTGILIIEVPFMMTWVAITQQLNS
jgi:hypothetical protein